MDTYLVQFSSHTAFVTTLLSSGGKNAARNKCMHNHLINSCIMHLFDLGATNKKM